MNRLKDFEELWSWGILDEPTIIQGIKYFYGVTIPEGSTDIRREKYGWEKIGTTKKLIPQDRFSPGWPTYVEIETNNYQDKIFLTWKNPKGIVEGIRVQ